ncbi:winged helix-turn-helix domain-containing protein [Kribbella sp. NBC_01510]|uniref:ArsR/SmtB family transcription factor n=1 Tax=Kribbella sp. NBC_01510 TaxID=2903581 RepID=UPI00386923A5
MIEYELAGNDLGEVRFAISPLNELALSLRTLRDPGRFPLQLPWLRATGPARAGLDLQLLRALTNESLWTPDFLTPRPYTPLGGIDDELAALTGTPAGVVRADLAQIHPATLPPALRGRPDKVLDRVLAALRDYWEACFEPHWARMRTVLEADVVYRGRVTAQAGLAAMFAGIDPHVRLDGTVLRVRLRSDYSYRTSTAGRGLTLTPSLFSRRGSVPISPDEPPHLIYPARGLGTLWEAETSTPPAALVGLVGRVRARLLGLLETPTSSTELAVRLKVTTTAVNQHLRALRAAGLLISARHGRSVLYRRSDLGDRLVRGM